MVDRDHALPLTAQARQLGISRGSIYYLPQPASDADLAIMRRMDEFHLLYPFAGSRMLRGLLRQEGVEVGRLHVATLMKQMRIEALYRRPDTSKPAPGHRVYPYRPMHCPDRTGRPIARRWKCAGRSPMRIRSAGGTNR